jgi:hypothetical protein
MGYTPATSWLMIRKAMLKVISSGVESLQMNNTARLLFGLNLGRFDKLG